MKFIYPILALAVLSSGAYAQSNSANAPRKQKDPEKSAKQYAPGQEKQSGESAKEYSPGHSKDSKDKKNQDRKRDPDKESKGKGSKPQ